MLIRLPNDLEEYVRKSVYKRIFTCLLSLLLVAIIIFLFGESFLEGADDNIKKTVYFVLLLVPFMISGIPHKLFDSGWNGKIINKEIKTVTDSTFKGITPRPVARNVISLTIQKDNGRLIFKEIKAERAPYMANDGDIKGIVDNYNVGDAVYKFFGLPYIVVSHAKKSDCLICAVCGSENPHNNKKCFNCDFSLIRFDNNK